MLEQLTALRPRGPAPSLMLCARTPETTQNGFSKAFREKFDAVATVDGGLQMCDEHTAADGTVKLVFELTTGPGKGGKIETVLIPVVREHDSKHGVKGRITL